MEHRVGARKRALAPAALSREECQELDELLVRVRDRRPDLAAPVGVQHQDLVVPRDLDVLDVRQIDQWLQPAEPEQAVEDGGSERLLVVEVHQTGASEGVCPCVVLEQTTDDRPPELAPVVLVDARARTQLLRELLGRALAEGSDEAPIDGARVVAVHPEGEVPDRSRAGRTGRPSAADGRLCRHGQDSQEGLCLAVEHSECRKGGRVGALVRPGRARGRRDRRASR